MRAIVGRVARDRRRGDADVGTLGVRGGTRHHHDVAQGEDFVFLRDGDHFFVSRRKLRAPQRLLCAIGHCDSRISCMVGYGSRPKSGSKML
jgi:hypothetical protein